MKHLSPNILRLTFGLIFSQFIFHSSATLADENKNMQESIQEEDDRSGGYFKWGLGYRAESSPFRKEEKGLTFIMNGRFQWDNGLFVELPGGSSEMDPSFSYGYNFYNTKNWDFDLLALKSHGDIDYFATNGMESIAIEQESSLMAGFRATGYYDDNTIQAIIAPYSYNKEYDNGLYASLWYSRHWLYKNWNFHASIGAQYRSEEILDYFYGVPEDIAITGTPAYQASSGINLSVQLGVEYAINEHWVFESYVRQTELASSITDSPVIYNSVRFDNTRSEDVSEFAILVSYVF